MSTRGYEASLEQPLERVPHRGASKSAVSRHRVPATRKKLDEYLSRRLDELDVLALIVDGVELAEHTTTVVVTIGALAFMLAISWELTVVSTQNGELCTQMLQDLLERELRIDDRLLWVIDGGKRIRKALGNVLGDIAVVHRCHVHRLRNLQSHLPKSRHAYVLGTMREAYRSTKADLTRKRLKALAGWLERNGYDEAAGSPLKDSKSRSPC